MKTKTIFSFILTIVVLNTSAQLKIGDQPTVHEKSVALDVKGGEGKQGLWLSRVPDTSVTGIRAFNPPDGLIIYHPPSGKIFFRSNNAWKEYLKNGILSIKTPSGTMTGPALANSMGNSGFDFNIMSSANTSVWNIRSASPTVRGVMNNISQRFDGTKTFNDGSTFNTGSTLNGGTNANEGLTLNGATGSNSTLTLGVTSATPGAAMTDYVLSADTIGNVIMTSQQRIKTFSNVALDGAPAPLTSGNTVVLSIVIPGAGLLNNFRIHVSPVGSGLKEGTSINWVRVFNSDTIKLAFRAFNSTETFTQADGTDMRFNVTIFEN